MAKKKKAPEGSSGAPAWMATFSDLMNLLLCFFVLLFAMSNVDAEKFQQVVASLQSSFSILPAGGATIGDGQMVGSGISQLKELDVYYHQAMPNNSDGDGDGGNADVKEQFEQEALKESEKMAEEIESELLKQGLSDVVNTDFNSSFVQLTLSGAILFDSGKSEIKPEAKDIIAKIGKIVEKYKENIIEIEGHTDNVPISTSIYPNNMMLSLHRAYSVFDYFVNVKRFDATSISSSGRGDAVPISSNATPEGRAQNRRVEIKIYNIYKISK